MKQIIFAGSISLGCAILSACNSSGGKSSTSSHTQMQDNKAAAVSSTRPTPTASLEVSGSAGQANTRATKKSAAVPTAITSVPDDFVAAACTGDAGIVSTFLNYVPNLDVNGVDSKGELALNCAIKNDHREVSSLLFEDSRLDLNAKDSAGLSPLGLILKSMKYDGVGKTLFSRFPKVNISDFAKDNNEFLHVLGSAGLCQTFAEFLKKPNIDINNIDSQGYTALMRLIQSIGGVDARVPYLRECVGTIFSLAKNIDLDIKAADGETLQTVSRGAWDSKVDRFPFLGLLYQYVSPLYAPKAFTVTELGKGGLYRSNSDLSKVVAFTFTNSEGPYGDLEGFNYYSSYSWTASRHFSFPKKWVVTCATRGCDETSIDDSYFFFFDTNELILKFSSDSQDCLLVNFESGDMREIDEKTCDQRLAGYSYVDPVLMGEEHEGYNRAGDRENYTKYLIPQNSDVSIIEYDLGPDGFPTVLALPNWDYVINWKNYIKRQGYGKHLLLKSPWGTTAIDLQ